jgi:hypothetical protein
VSRNYSTTAVATTLSAGITNVATSLTVASSTGFPAVPFAAVIDPDNASAEAVLVTAVSGTTWTVERGLAGTTGVAHNLGAVVKHMLTSEDIQREVRWLAATRTLTSQTAAQAIFDTPSGASVKANRLYRFSGFVHLTGMSATSGSFGFALGGTAVLASQQWHTRGVKAATLATAATQQGTFNTAANTTIVTASTATVGWFEVEGFFRVTTAGTVIPQVSLGVAAAATVNLGTYFEVEEMGVTSTSTPYIGPWA